MKEGSK